MSELGPADLPFRAEYAKTGMIKLQTTDTE
jgi:hypothetical protein